VLGNTCHKHDTHQNPTQDEIHENARNFAVVTAGLENTPEGAALLAALKQVEKANE
jgi:hypothetical protein